MSVYPADHTVDEATKRVEDWWKKTWRARTLRVGGISLLLFSVWFIWQTNKPLYTIESVTMTPKIASPGDMVLMDYVMRLNKSCSRREITKYLVKVGGDATSYVVGRHMGTLGTGPTEMISVQSALRIPENINPGKYSYQFVVHALCKPIGHSANFIYQGETITVR